METDTTVQPLSSRRMYDSIEDASQILMSDRQTKLEIEAAYVVDLNQDGMKALSQLDYKRARRQLKLSEQILLKSNTDPENKVSQQDWHKLYALTMNNLGCYYKK